MSFHTVQLRGGFSDRNSINKINTAIQLKSFDKRTKIALINLMDDWIFDDHNQPIISDFFTELIRQVFSEYIDYDIQQLINYNRSSLFKNYIYNSILECDEYDEILTLIEYITKYYNENSPLYYPSFPGEGVKRNYGNELNEIFEKEYVGYRFVGEYIVPIVDKEEIIEIEQTLESQFKGCKTHISKALGFLSNRDNPDYKNSIKESISAVESICQIITSNKKATLGEAIDLLDKNNIQLHPAMKEAFKKIYGYTSDQGGIRHAEGMFESDVSFDDAKYMLVSCCAFVNYLISKYDNIERK